MYRHLLFIAVLAPLTLFAQSAPPSTADADYAAIEKLAYEGPKGITTRAQYYEWHLVRFGKVIDATDAFMKNHPDDPRRWLSANMLAISSNWMLDFVKSQQKKAVGLLEQGLKASDIREADWASLKTTQVNNLMVPLMAQAYDLNPKTPPIAELRRAIDELAARSPDAQSLPMQEFAYLEIIEKQDPALGRAWRQHLASNSRNKTIATRAAGELRFQQLRESPVDIKFTALDGRKVDLAKLRGKVVLVDFWATWCGPCVQEMPNVQAVHEKYRQQGFEVVGVTLDARGDRKKVEDFVRKRNIPWAQFLDEKNDTNSLAQHYGITEIPAALLFDKNGILVSDQARGAELEVLVRKLTGG